MRTVIVENQNRNQTGDARTVHDKRVPAIRKFASFYSREDETKGRKREGEKTSYGFRDGRNKRGLV